MSNEKDIKQINTYEFDERFYQRLEDGTPVYVPSVTYILSEAYPTSYGLIKWIGDVGNETARQIRDEAGEIGTFVHESIEVLLQGGQVHADVIERKFRPRNSLQVKRCLKSFLDWFRPLEASEIETEFITWNSELGYAGTVDLKCRIGDDLYLIDFKTSNSIHTSHRIQLAAYNYSDNGSKAKCAILHLGNKTKKRYSFLELDKEKEEDYMEQFYHALALFKLRNPNAKPSTETFPEYFAIKEEKNGD